MFSAQTSNKMSTTTLGESDDVPIESKSDSKPNEAITTSTSVVSPMNGGVSPMNGGVSPMDGGGSSMDGVCAKESGADVEEKSSAVKRKVEQLQAPDAKKPRVSSEKSVISEDVISNTNPLHEGIVIPTDGPSQESKLNVTILATYESETITRMEYGWENGRVSVISWGSIENVTALVEDGLLSTTSNWKLIPEQFKDALVTTAIEKNRWVLEFFSEQRKNELDHSVLVSAIELAPCVYKHLSQQQKQRKDLVIRCLDSICEGATEEMEFIPNVFKSDIDVVLLLIHKYAADRPDLDMDILSNPYEWCDQELFWNPLFVMQAVREDYGIMSHVRSHHTEMYERLQDNKPFVMRFISTYKNSWDSQNMINPLHYVSERLRDDPDVLNQVAHADDSNGSIYQDTLDYASKRLCESPDFVIGILEDLDDDVDQDEVRKMLARNCPFLACDIDFIKRVIKERGAEATCWFHEWFQWYFVREFAIDRLSRLE